MKKFAIISNSAFSVVNFRIRLIEDITARGWKVYILAPDFNDKFRNRLDTIGGVPVDIKMARTGLNPVGDILSLLDLIRKLRRIAPDITFSYGIKPVIYGLMASRFAGVPNRYAMVAGLGTLYVNTGNNLSFKNQFLRRFADFMYKLSFESADRVFFQNPDDIKLFEENNRIASTKSVLLNGSGVDIDYYQTNLIQTEILTFTLVSRLIKEKGIFEFVESAKRVKEKYPEKNFKFILLGEPDLNPNSIDRDTLKHWTDNQIIEWPGHVDNVKYWLEKTSVFVLPSYYREGTPKSILEAMAMSRPIITTNTPGCRETVSEGINGFFVTPMDSESLFNALDIFIQDPGLINKMGKESRKIAEYKYDIKKINSKILSIMNIVV